jgi:DNA damage-inducible protein 1
MRLTVCNQTTDAVAQIEIDDLALIENLKAMISIELNCEGGRKMELSFNGTRILDDEGRKTVREIEGLSNDDMILVTFVSTQAQAGNINTTTSNNNNNNNNAWASIVPPTNQQQQQQQQRLEKDAREQMDSIKREIEFGGSGSAPPELEKILKENDVNAFIEYVKKQNSRMNDSKRKEQELYARLERDPFDAEAQKEIERILKQKRNDDTYQTMMEEMPEMVFGHVIMLYCSMELNGHKMKVFIDSGAQMSIMGMDCARKCNLEKDIDERFAGVARGVGTQKIRGKVLQAQVKVGSAYLPCSLSILEGQTMEFIFGLDMLKRHQCSIDLKKNVLHIGTTGEEIPFLGESEIPKQSEEEEQDMNIEAELLSNNNKKKNVRGEDEVAPEASAIQERADNEQTRTEVSGIISPPFPVGGSSAAAVTGGGGSPLPPNEEAILNLMQLGFSRDRVIQALGACGNNEDMAASLLFSD